MKLKNWGIILKFTEYLMISSLSFLLTNLSYNFSDKNFSIILAVLSILLFSYVSYRFKKSKNSIYEFTKN